MQGIVIAPVMPGDVPLLDAALRQLAADIGDDYTADQTGLGAAVCGPEASCLARLATLDGSPVGAVLAAPVFSTIRGGAGLFVSDLWVAEPTRGNGSERRWRPTTPAMAAGMTNPVWTTTELLSYRIPASFLDMLHTMEHLFPSLDVAHQGS